MGRRGAARQVLAAAQARLTVDEALRAVADARPDFSPTGVTLSHDPRAPLVVTAGRNRSLFVNPYTGNVTEPAGQRARAFFETVEGWHRWFNVAGDRRALARAVTGACNLAFLFLVLSGVYLWLPRAWAWTALSTRLLFNRLAVSAKARDFNWHHVFGIWSAVPLAIIVASAVVMSYPWANTLVYRAFGEQPPVRGGARAEGGEPGRGNGAARAADSLPRSDAAQPNGSTPSVGRKTYDEIFARAAAEAGDWRTVTLTLPAERKHGDGKVGSRPWQRRSTPASRQSRPRGGDGSGASPTTVREPIARRNVHALGFGSCTPAKRSASPARSSRAQPLSRASS